MDLTKMIPLFKHKGADKEVYLHEMTDSHMEACEKLFKSKGMSDRAKIYYFGRYLNQAVRLAESEGVVTVVSCYNISVLVGIVLKAIEDAKEEARELNHQRWHEEAMNEIFSADAGDRGE